MTNDEMFDSITKHRHLLVQTLESFTNVEWNQASLCAGWMTRDVVGHLLSILEIPVGKFLLNVAKARNFDRYADRVAREFGTAEPADLVRRFRASADKRFAPPVIGPIAPLADLFVHIRDIERPVGRPSQLDPATVKVVLGFLCSGKARGFTPPARTKGLRFEATDMQFSAGEGDLVRGPGEAIMMAVAGRKDALDELSGPGSTALSLRLSFN